jgi:hypothetical protein
VFSGCYFQIFDLRIFSRARIIPFQPIPLRQYLGSTSFPVVCN